MNKNIWLPLRIMAPAMANRMQGRLSPAKVGIQVTNRCNMDCGYCYAGSGEESDHGLSFDEITGIIDDLKRMNISILVFTGGEPLLREDLNELIRYARNKRILTGLATNGLLLTGEAVRDHKNAGLNWYHFSLDSPTDREYIRSRQLSADSTNIIEQLKSVFPLIHRMKMRIIATTVVTKENQHTLQEIADFLIEHKVAMWSPTLAVPCGRGISYLRDNLLTPEEVEVIYRTIIQLSRRHRKRLSIYMMDPQIYYPYLIRETNPSWLKNRIYQFMARCPVVKGSTIHICHDGRVKPCAYFSGYIPDANVKEESIITIFREHPYLNSLRDTRNLKGRCHDCKYQSLCSGCRSRANAIHHDVFEEDLYCFYR